MSSKPSSSVGCGRSKRPDPLIAERGIRDVRESRLCLGGLVSAGNTGDRAEMSCKYRSASAIHGDFHLATYKRSPVRVEGFARDRKGFILAQHTSVIG